MKTEIYYEYLASTMVIDVRLLRLLYRFGSRELYTNEQFLQSASDIIQHLQQQFPSETFDYMSPDYVLEWYSCIGAGPAYYNVIPGADTDEYPPDKSPAYPTYILLPLFEWRKRILHERMERLKLTGYEHL